LAVSGRIFCRKVYSSVDYRRFLFRFLSLCGSPQMKNAPHGTSFSLIGRLDGTPLVLAQQPLPEALPRRKSGYKSQERKKVSLEKLSCFT
jgi:hypothetical protein